MNELQFYKVDFFCSFSLILSSACYKPSLQNQYTEESNWTPFDFLSRLVKEWEGAGQLPENSAKKTRQVIIRPGESKQTSHSIQIPLFNKDALD